MEEKEMAKVLLVNPGEKPKVIEIDTSLKSLQKTVGGYIETVYPFDDNFAVLICNEEGKLNGMPLNRALYGDDGDILDVVAGPFIIAGVHDEFDSLTREQIQKYEEMFREPELISFAGNGDCIVMHPVTA